MKLFDRISEISDVRKFLLISLGIVFFGVLWFLYVAPLLGLLYFPIILYLSDGEALYYNWPQIWRQYRQIAFYDEQMPILGAVVLYTIITLMMAFVYSPIITYAMIALSLEKPLWRILIYMLLYSVAIPPLLGVFAIMALDN